MNAPKTYLNEDEAAAYIGVSPYTLERYRRQKIGPPYIRVGGNKLVSYKRAAIDDWMQSHEVRATAHG